MDANLVEQALIEENGATWMNYATIIDQTASGSMLGERLFADSANRVRLLRFSQVALPCHVRDSRNGGCGPEMFFVCLCDGEA